MIIVFLFQKEKLVQNGKANGSTATKSSAPSKKEKKETTEKHAVEKTNVVEKKSPTAEKKVLKNIELC